MIFKRLFTKVRGRVANSPAPAAAPPPVIVTVTAADLTALHHAAVATADLTARARYLDLICAVPASAHDGAPEPLTLPTALAALANVTDADLLGQIATRAVAADIRRVAIANLPTDAAALVQCAVEDASAPNRLLAVERLDQRAGLEQVVKRIGKRDSRVYRHAREKLRQLAQREARPAQVRQLAAALCAEVERLGRHQMWSQDRARLTHLTQQWQEIAAEVTAAEQAQFDQLRRTFLTAFDAAQVATSAAAAVPLPVEPVPIDAPAVDQITPAAVPAETLPVVELPAAAAELPISPAPLTAELSAEPALSAENSVAEQPFTLLITADELPAHLRPRQALLAQLDALGDLNDAAELTAQLTAIGEQWQQLELAQNDVGDALADQHLLALRQAFQTSFAQMTARQRALATCQQRDAQLAQLCDEVKHLLVHGDIVDLPVAQQLRQRFERLCVTNERNLLTRDCAILLTRLEQRLTRQRNQVTRRLSATVTQLAALERHLTAGELRKAEPLYQKIAATVDHAHAAGLPRTEIVALERQLKRLALQLRELQHWRRWSVEQHREALCHDAEALLAAVDEDLAVQAQRLQTLQRAWQQLDHSGTSPHDAFRPRFRAALDQVMARCQPYFAQRASVQAAQLQARLALCEELETFLDKVDWERVDWKKLVSAKREMRQAWSALGAVDERHGRALDTRFRRSIERVDRALYEERQRNLALKRELIRQMEALADEPHLEYALSQAKTLQQQWHTSVAGRRRDENALWTAFRTASERLFNRRANEREARHLAHQDHISRREALCRAVEELAGQSLPASELLNRWEHLEQQWSHTPPASSRDLDQRWRAARAAVLARHQKLCASADWQALQHLAAYAALCDYCGAVLTGDAAQLALITLPESCSSPPPLDDSAAGDAALADWFQQEWAALPACANATAQATFAERRAWLLAAAGDDTVARSQLHQWRYVQGQQRATLCLQLEIVAHLESPPELLSARLELQVARLKEKMTEGAALADKMALLQAWYLCAPAEGTLAVLARFERVLATARVVEVETA
ncbi:DUF349 domain-containing protein [Thiospirillum jenense]|uniref:DUF349 domain-containing protein n=1 Tax=Thiospirillum jenense TaxID=1653858 RepID=A0A839HGR2_9GAMM|nr:DUF349 domain-containing protein [Thiospirillum jenense]MBB1127160.1 DUF349 domain-containing protein [Thiospirillum jenense]